jgi:hypothetical protein
MEAGMKMTAFWDVAPGFALITEVLMTSETTGNFYKAIRRSIRQTVIFSVLLSQPIKLKQNFKATAFFVCTKNLISRNSCSCVLAYVH